MVLLRTLYAALLLAVHVRTETILSGTRTASTTSSIDLGDGIPTGSEVTYPGTSDATLPTSSYGSMTISSTSMAAANSSGSTTSSSTSNPLTLLVGGTKTTASTSRNATLGLNATTTSSTARPTNTRPCNGHPEFCTRKYSNITHVAAHNSPFVQPHNAASNQAFTVEYQLNDGIRMLQFQTHFENNTMFLCHTSCDLLNAGTLEDYLKTVRSWVQNRNYDVITILMGNSNLVDPGNFTAPFANAGLLPYIYSPPKVLMGINDWPTLGEMILTGKRVVVMMDYQANQTAIPWLIDEFSVMWETPFSPQDRAFPCTLQRPPGLLDRDAIQRLYMANHNLNTDISLLGSSLLVPTVTLLNETNAANASIYGSLGRAAVNCTQTWNRRPNFLLVDYYNTGSSNGSVFEVAATMNNVTYTQKCCGTAVPSAASHKPASSLLLPVTSTALLAVFLAGWT